MTSNNFENVLILPNCRKNQNVVGALYSYNNLSVYPFKPPSKSDLHNSSHGNLFLNFISHQSWMWEKNVRRLVNEAVGTFISLQTVKEKKDNLNENKPFFVKKTREYRSMIQACVGEINAVVEAGSSSAAEVNEEEKAELSANCQLLYKMELVLGLIEILFIDTQPNGTVLSQLLGWIRLHFPKCKNDLAEAMSLDSPHTYSLYWDTVYGLILQCYLDEARSLLSRHPKSTSDPFVSINELLHKMPFYQVYSGVSESEFTVRWLHWQDECRKRLERGEFASMKQLEIICQILCGQTDTILSLVDILETWYHAMISVLFYTNPCVKIFRLPQVAQETLAAMNINLNLGPFDQLLISILEADVTQVVKQCQLVIRNIWFTFHLADLLHHSTQSNSGFMKEIREFLLLEYAGELVNHCSLWQVGLLYLDHCNEATGSAMVECVLQRVPLDSEDKAKKVIHMASSRNLEHIVTSVCRVMGRKALGQQRLGAAVWWGIRSKDSGFTSHLAHKILHVYLSEREFDSSSLLDHLGPSMLLSNTLTFLGKYREFHLLYQDGKFRDAASLLTTLISSKLVPEYFWPVLLLDSLPLLKSEEPVFSSDQIYELMYCLHDLSNKASSK